MFPLTLQMLSSVSTIWPDSVSNQIRLTRKLNFLLPILSSTRPPLLQPPHGSDAHSSTSPLSLLVFAPHPNKTGEPVLSGVAEYPGPLPSPPLLRYPSMIYFCPCISHAFSEVPLTSLCTKQMKVVTDGFTAKKISPQRENLQTAPLNFPPDYVIHYNIFL